LVALPAFPYCVFTGAASRDEQTAMACHLCDMRTLHCCSGAPLQAEYFFQFGFSPADMF
jgi:hypothetical protein